MNANHGGTGAPQKESLTDKLVAPLAWISVLVFLLWSLILLSLHDWNSGGIEMNEFGDAYAPATGLLTGVGLIIAAISLSLQRKELKNSTDAVQRLATSLEKERQDSQDELKSKKLEDFVARFREAVDRFELLANTEELAVSTSKDPKHVRTLRVVDRNKKALHKSWLRELEALTPSDFPKEEKINRERIILIQDAITTTELDLFSMARSNQQYWSEDNYPMKRYMESQRG